MKFLRVSPRAEPLLNISTRPIKLFRVINSRVVERMMRIGGSIALWAGERGYYRVLKKI